MLYITTALFEEALPFLSKYSLKKDTSFPRFELFSSDSVRLLITKTGAVRSAIAVSCLLTRYPASRGDFFLSVGTAACPDSSVACGSPFLIRKITDSASGRTYFPELLYQSPFPEAELITTPFVQKTIPVRPEEAVCGGFEPPASSPLLYDMESSGIYEAAGVFFATHQMAFLKVVSDHITDLAQFSPSMLRTHVTGCIEKNLPDICSWSQGISSLLSAPPRLSPEESALFDAACAALRLSVSSRNQLHQLMLYLHLAGIPYLEAMKELLAAPLHTPCQTKKEGKYYLEQLCIRFL